MPASRRRLPFTAALRSPLDLISAAFLSALAITLYSRSEWPWIALGFVALVPWLAALGRVKSLRGAVLAGLVMSEAYVLVLFHWLPRAMQDFSGAPGIVCLLVVALAAPLIAPQFVALSLARRVASTGWAPRGWPVVALASAFAYVGIDWAMPKLMADTLGHPLYGSTLLRQAADVAGVHGLTFIVLLANECVLAIAKGAAPRPGATVGWRSPFACLIALVLVPLAYGAVRHRQFSIEQPGATPITAGLVQAGLSHYDRAAAELGAHRAVRTILDTHVALSREALDGHRLDLLLWPETVYPLVFGAAENEQAASFERRIEELVWRTGVPLVFGAYDADDGQSFNAAIFLEPSGRSATVAGAYRKARLFPLSEWVPAPLDHQFVRSRLPWLGTWSPGPGGQAIAITLADGRSLRVAPLICYDALVPGLALAAVRDGAEIIFTLSNDSWFAYRNAPSLLLALSAFRSIETRRPQLRVTNTGITAVITATGEIAGMLDQSQHGVLVGSVRPGRGNTLMLRLGDWFGPTSLVAAVLLLILPPAIRRSRGPSAPDDGRPQTDQTRNRSATSAGTPPK